MKIIDDLVFYLGVDIPRDNDTVVVHYTGMLIILCKRTTNLKEKEQLRIFFIS